MVTLRRLLGVARLVFTVGSHGSAMTLLTPLCARVELRAVLVCLFVCFLACVHTDSLLLSSWRRGFGWVFC